MAKSTALGPLRTALKRAYGLATTIEKETEGLINVVDQAGLDADELEMEMEKVDAAARQLIQTIRLGKARAAEMKEIPSAADKMADSQLIDEGLDSLLSGMPAYQLARELEIINIDAYYLALRELASYETGVERLVELRDQAQRALQEVL